MFESFVSARSAHRGVRAAGFVISLAVHTAVIGGLVVLPLVFVRALPGADLLTFLIEPPPPAPVPPERPSHPAEAQGPGVIMQGLVVPERMPDAIPPPEADTVVLSGPGIAAASGIPGSVLGAPGGPPGFAAPTGPPAPLPIPQAPAAKRAPERIGGDVQASKLIRRVDPVYPELARRARVHGVVILEVTVDEEGAVAEARLLRGHPLLDEAALSAVRQWRYSPTLLNGEPVRVIATVTVIFNLR
jgi:protein TonB